MCVSSAYLSAYSRNRAAHALKEALGDGLLLALTVTPYLRAYHTLPRFFLGKKEALGDLRTRSGTERAAPPLPRECRPSALGTPGLVSSIQVSSIE